MKAKNTSKKIHWGSILKALCPVCHQGRILKNVFGVHSRCSVCQHDFHPEPGYFLGAMAVSFFVTGALTLPPMIALKWMNVDLAILLAYPFFQFSIVGPLLAVYSRVIWIHLEYRTLRALDGEYTPHHRE